MNGMMDNGNANMQMGMQYANGGVYDATVGHLTGNGGFMNVPAGFQQGVTNMNFQANGGVQDGMIHQTVGHQGNVGQFQEPAGMFHTQAGTPQPFQLPQQAQQGGMNDAS